MWNYLKFIVVIFVSTSYVKISCRRKNIGFPQHILFVALFTLRGLSRRDNSSGAVDQVEEGVHENDVVAECEVAWARKRRAR